jgi:transposase-like protein
MRELSVAEQRYQAVLAVISDGETVSSVAARFGVARKTLHAWLNKYEAGGLEGLVDASHRPSSCPHQMSSVVEVAVVELRRAHPSWGPRRLRYNSPGARWRWSGSCRASRRSTGVWCVMA